MICRLKTVAPQQFRAVQVVRKEVVPMQTKQYLKELKRLDTCINQKLQEKAALYTSTIGAARTDKDRVQTSGNGDTMPELIQRIIDLEAEIDKEIGSFADQKHTIINQIQALKNKTYVSLLCKRYVEFKRLEEIAVEMNYTYPYVRKMHGYALTEFQRVHEDAIAAYEAALEERRNTKEHSDML